MKNKRGKLKEFERVVEWEEKPEYLKTFIFFICLFTTLIVIPIIISDSSTTILGRSFGVLFFSVASVGNTLNLYDSLGKGKRVVWREVK